MAISPPEQFAKASQPSNKQQYSRNFPLGDILQLRSQVHLNLLSMSKALFWNIRGLAKPSALARLKVLKRQFGIKLLALCEPRIQINKC